MEAKWDRRRKRVPVWPHLGYWILILLCTVLCIVQVVGGWNPPPLPRPPSIEQYFRHSYGPFTVEPKAVKCQRLNGYFVKATNFTNARSAVRNFAEAFRLMVHFDFHHNSYSGIVCASEHQRIQMQFHSVRLIKFTVGVFAKRQSSCKQLRFASLNTPISVTHLSFN